MPLSVLVMIPLLHHFSHCSVSHKITQHQKNADSVNNWKITLMNVFTETPRSLQ